MRSNTFRMRKVKKWLAVAGLFLCLLLTAVPVYADEEPTTAAAIETTAETTTAETKTEEGTTKAAEPETKQEEKAESKPEVSSLPTGNLTLVDDVISAADAHREFLTVVSKDGSYFYIVIDRDTDGAGNVYFLNLVDNQDLYKLTGEKAPTVSEEEADTQIILDPQKDSQKDSAEEQKTVTAEEAAAQKQKSLMITVGVGAAIVVGAVIFVLKKRKNKQAAKQEFDLSDFEDDDE